MLETQRIETPMNTPSQALAAEILERLIREGLITSEAAKPIQPKLADGKLKQMTLTQGRDSFKGT